LWLVGPSSCWSTLYLGCPEELEFARSMFGNLCGFQEGLLGRQPKTRRLAWPNGSSELGGNLPGRESCPVEELPRAARPWQESAMCQLTQHLPAVRVHEPASQPALPQTPSIPRATPTPVTSSSLCPTMLGQKGRQQRVGRTPQGRAPTHMQLLLVPIFSLGRSMGSAILVRLQPALPLRAIADCLLPPFLLGHLADHLRLHPCPSALHSLWVDSGHHPLLCLPGSPCPLLPSFSLSLSFLPLSAAFCRSLKPPLSITQWTGLRYCHRPTPHPFLGQEVWAQEEGVDGDLEKPLCPEWRAGVQWPVPQGRQSSQKLPRGHNDSVKEGSHSHAYHHMTSSLPPGCGSGPQMLGPVYISGTSILAPLATLCLLLPGVAPAAPLPSRPPPPALLCSAIRSHHTGVISWGRGGAGSLCGGRDRQEAKPFPVQQSSHTWAWAP
jgi:hypothetical protein